MRTLTGQDTKVLQAPDGYSVRARVFVWNGSAWQDVTTLEGRDWLVSVEWDESINEPCAQATVQLRRRLEDFSLNPLLSNKLTGVLALARPFYVEAATLPLGDEPQSGDWREVFRGKIERLALDKDPITFTGRDDAGALLRAYIETDREYGNDTTGVAVQTVMQSILTDNSTGVTLYVPVSPGVVLSKYKQKKAPVLAGVRERALTIGWDARYFWDNGTGAFRFTLLKPDRAGLAGSQWTFQPGQVRRVTKMEQSIDGVRNVVLLYYYNRSTTDPGGKPTLSSVTSSDATSIITYGRGFMQLAEDENSPIDSPTEAQAMADAARDDLKDPLLDMSVEVGFHYGVQLRDQLTFAADDDNFSSDQTLAVVSAAHRIDAKGHSTTLTLRGKPVGAHRSWLQREGRAMPQPRAAQPDTITGLVATGAPSSATVTFAQPTVPPFPAEYELHKSTTSGSTPSSSTFHERANTTTFVVNGLTPGTTYYFKVVPIDEVGNRGTASSEVSATARYVEPRTLQPYVAAGALPPNADFEAVNGSIPDTWSVLAGSWGTDITSSTDSFSGGTSIKFPATHTATLASQLMTVRPSQTYCARVYMRASGTTTSVVSVGIRWYSTVGGTGTLYSETKNATSNAWTEVLVFDTAPSTARYAEVLIFTGGTASIDVYVDSLEFLPTSLPQRPWKMVGPSIGGGYSVAFENSWSNYGSPHGDVGFRLNTLGNLELKGVAKAPTPAPGIAATVFTLSTGYRPSVQKLFRLYLSGGGTADIRVGSDGKVSVYNISAGDVVSFDGLSFALP